MTTSPPSDPGTTCRNLIEELVTVRGDSSKVKYHSKYNKSELWSCLAQVSMAMADEQSLMDAILIKISPTNGTNLEEKRDDEIPEKSPNQVLSTPSFCVHAKENLDEIDKNKPVVVSLPKICKSRWSGTDCVESSCDRAHPPLCQKEACRGSRQQSCLDWHTIKRKRTWGNSKKGNAGSPTLTSKTGNKGHSSKGHSSNGQKQSKQGTRVAGRDLKVQLMKSQLDVLRVREKLHKARMGMTKHNSYATAAAQAVPANQRPQLRNQPPRTVGPSGEQTPLRAPPHALNVLPTISGHPSPLGQTPMATATVTELLMAVLAKLANGSSLS